jgi:lysophospholipase L1-like esterase
LLGQLEFSSPVILDRPAAPEWLCCLNTGAWAGEIYPVSEVVLMFQFLSTTTPDDPQPAPRPLTTGRKLLFAGITVLIVLVAIELGLRLFYRPVRAEPIDQRLARIPEYAHLDWPKELFREEYQGKTKFVPWVMWRHKEYHGKYINVSSDGIRKTWNPPVTKGQKVKKVFCFGGSTTWGVGARDDYTIPSLLSKKLNQGADRYVVVNYGERGFTLSQEVINLVDLLIQGNIPDYVIFYDGVNEAMVGALNRKAGLFFGAGTVEFKLFQMEEEPFWVKLRRDLRETSIYTGLKELKAWFQRRSKKASGYSPEELKELNQLADSIKTDYLDNVEFVQRLSRCYGFKYLFFWQPSLFTNKALTAEEKKAPSWNYMDWVKTTQLVYDRMANVKMDHFYNISTMFDHKKKTLFFSWAHIIEDGNEQVAERIYQTFQQNYAPNLSAGPGSPQAHH